MRRPPPLFAAVLGMCFVVASRGQDPVLVGSWPGYAQMPTSYAAAQGRYACLLGGSDEDAILQVLDLADPAHPAPVVAIPLPGFTTGLVMSGRWLFCAGGAHFQVMDLADPAKPVVVGSCEYRGGCAGLAVSSNHVFVAARGSPEPGRGGLQIIDVSDPANPTWVGSLDALDTANGVAVAGHYALVADGQAGLQVIDVIDPANPVRVGTHDTQGSCWGVAVSGHYAFIADSYLPGGKGGEGLVIVDIRDPANPVRVARDDALGPAYEVVMAGRYAYVNHGYLLIEVLDVSDPFKPVEVGTYWHPDGRGFALAGMSGDHLLLTHDGLEVVDVSDPANLKPVGQLDTRAYASAVAISGDYAFLADETALEVINVHESTAPVRAGRLKLESAAMGLALSGKTAFVSSPGGGNLEVVDVSDPAKPAQVGRVPHRPGGGVTDVALCGRYALLAEPFGMEIFDLADRARPVRVATNSISASRIILSGHYALVTGYGFSVVDTTTPTNLVTVARLEIEAGPLALSGHYAFAGGYSWATGSPRLEVIDVANLEQPQHVGSYETGGESITGLAASGDYVFVTEHYGGLEVFEVSDPKNPRRVGGFDRRTAKDVVVSGNRVLVANGVWGLSILDCSALLGQTPRLLPLVGERDGWTVRFTGDTNTTYQVWRSAGVEGTWVPLGSAVATDGLGAFHDSAPLPGRAFYRVVRP